MEVGGGQARPHERRAVRPGERSDPPDRGPEAPPAPEAGRCPARRQGAGETDRLEGAADPDGADEEFRSRGTAAGSRGGASGVDAMARNLPLPPLATGALAAVRTLA